MLIVPTIIAGLFLIVKSSFGHFVGKFQGHFLGSVTVPLFIAYKGFAYPLRKGAATEIFQLFYSVIVDVVDHFLLCWLLLHLLEEVVFAFIASHC